MKFSSTSKKLILAEFAPVILILGYYLYPTQFLQITNTFLGKFALLLIVILYSSIDKLYGALAGLLFIVFYQSDMVEGFEQIYHINDLLHYEGAISTDPARKMLSSSLGGSGSDVSAIDAFTSYDVAPPPASPAKAAFVSQKCVNGRLLDASNNLYVKTEMIPHIYPEIVFGEAGTCNPCDNTCNFSIAEAKIKVEEKIMIPQSSNSWYDKIVQSIVPMSGGRSGGGATPASSPGVISEMFSSFSP